MTTFTVTGVEKSLDTIRPMRPHFQPGVDVNGEPAEAPIIDGFDTMALIVVLIALGKLVERTGAL